MSAKGQVFLTMHPDAFEGQWDLQFPSYDLSALQRYRDAADKEDIEIPGCARNVSGGENAIAPSITPGAASSRLLQMLAWC